MLYEFQSTFVSFIFTIIQGPKIMKNTIQNLRQNWKVSVLFVTLCLIASFVPFSLLLGWNLILGILFWFFLVPLISWISSKFCLCRTRQIIVGIGGCIFFYLIMIFMIYSHYQTDMFKLMIFSSFTSMALIWFLGKIYLLKELT